MLIPSGRRSSDPMPPPIASGRAPNNAAVEVIPFDENDFLAVHNNQPKELPLDHAIRVLTGHAEAKLPSQSQVEALDALLRRWTPIPLSELEDIRAQTRSAFEKLFG